MELTTILGFFTRQMKIALSYRSEIFFDIASMLAWAFTIGFLGKFINSIAGTNISKFLQGCSNYQTFLSIGFIVQLLVWSARGNVSWLVRSKEFPSFYMTPHSLFTIIVGANMWKYVWILMQVFIFTIISTTLFGISIHLNISFVIAVIGGMILMTSLDMVGAAYRIITKSESDPFNWLLGTTSYVFSSRIFPIEVLPSWLRPIARFHPEFIINNFARRTMGGGASLKDVAPSLCQFFLVILVFLAISIFAFYTGFNFARKRGTLGHQ